MTQAPLDFKVLRSKMSLRDVSRFNYLARELREVKQTIEILTEFEQAVNRDTEMCDKHYIAPCYTCSSLSRIQFLLRKARKLKATLSFSMSKLIRAYTDAPAEASGERFLRETAKAEKERRPETPLDRLFGFVRSDSTQRMRQSDVNDNIRLLDAWLAASDARKYAERYMEESD